MTYCVAAMLDAGMVFASDSRTNAGVDHISTFRKMHVVEKPGDRVIVILTSGNLSITQNTINTLEHAARQGSDGNHTVYNATSLFEVAELIGNALREVRQRDGPWLTQGNIDAGASMLVGGQIRGEPQRLFHIYGEGNFIEATADTPYFQIGESKYGKPVIDRVIKRGIGLEDAGKCILVSFDSTMRSNISVGMPIDLLVYRTNELKVALERRIEENDPYFQMIHSRWGEGLRRVFAELPAPEWIPTSNP
jgi:putative proteasome-type protease